MNIKTVKKVYEGILPNGNQLGNYELTLLDDTKLLVPLNTQNRHYQAIQEWIAEGNPVIDNPPE